eukprot:832131-Pelagomonas_calceolata.AAC.1
MLLPSLRQQQEPCLQQPTCVHPTVCCAGRSGAGAAAIAEAAAGAVPSAANLCAPHCVPRRLVRGGCCCHC